MFVIKNLYSRYIYLAIQGSNVPQIQHLVQFISKVRSNVTLKHAKAVIIKAHLVFKHIMFQLRKFNVYGHTMVKIRHPVRSAKSSTIGPG